MTYLSLSSKGEIDAQALCLMGASVKDIGAIGEFGSGLKYAIATLLRYNVPFEVWSGLRQIDISVKMESFRGETFGVIYIDGKATSITTRTGPKWHIRNAIREIWSNALDEGEARVDHAEPCEGRTTFRIALVDDVKYMVDNWHMFFIADLPHIFACSQGRMLSQSTPNFFRRGIWICEDRQCKSIFSYDFAEFNLPESRLVSSYACAAAIAEVLIELTDVDIWHKIINHAKVNGMMEISCLQYYTLEASAEAAVKSAFHRDWTHFGNSEDRPRLTEYIKSEHKVLWCDGYLYAFLSRLELPNIRKALDFNDNYQVRPWPIGAKSRVDTEIAHLAKFNINMAKFDFAYAEFTSTDTIAQANMEKDLCLIGDKALEVSPTMLRKALIEEWTHLEHKVSDCTIAQQHVYLDLIVKLMDARATAKDGK